MFMLEIVGCDPKTPKRNLGINTKTMNTYNIHSKFEVFKEITLSVGNLLQRIAFLQEKNCSR